MSRLELRGVSKLYGKVKAADSIGLEARDGEFLILVGPSGCGKSTILRIIAGLEAPTTGRVLLDGKDITDLSPRERNVAMVFQNYALYPHMTVRKNLSFPLRMRGTPRSFVRAKVIETARSLGLVDLLDRYPSQLSGGQRQRVALGRAIIREPALFLLDEPLSNLDAALRLSMRAELLRLHARLKVTTVYVTHDQVEAMTMGDRLVVLREGRVEQIASPEEIYRRPATVFTARFIGSPAMNVFPCSVDFVQGETVLRAGNNSFRIDSSSFDLAGRSEVSVGIRPESLHPVDPDKARLRGVVELVELLGKEKVLYVKGVGAENLLVVTRPGFSAPPGSTVHLDFEDEALHLFDRVTGRSLRRL